MLPVSVGFPMTRPIGVTDGQLAAMMRACEPLEQQVTDTVGLFARAGWADGNVEPWDFTDIDHIETLIREAADIQQKATDGRQYSAATAALIAKAKLAGRWVERTEQNNTNINYAVSDQPMSEQEWVEKHVTEH